MTIERVEEKPLVNHWISLLLENDSNQLMANVDTKFIFIKSYPYVFPTTINQEEYQNSYVVSVYTAFISYAKEELIHIKNKPFRMGLHVLLTSLAKLFKLVKINQIIFVNNYLLSTNLYPNWHGEDIHEITQSLIKKYPNHIVAFRSLNNYQNEKLLHKFKKAEYHSLVSRQIYLFDHEKNPFHTKTAIIRDKRLLQDNYYLICSPCDITDKDYERIAELYNMLYLDKYSYHNPQFTVKFIALCHQKETLQIYGLRNQQGILDGVIGFFTIENTTTAPLVGYHTNLPQELGLYRRLMVIAFNYAKDHNYLLNLSSGAASFKRLRGGVPHIEYSAVYFKHLSFFRRLFWRLFISLINPIAKYLLQKYQL